MSYLLSFHKKRRNIDLRLYGRHFQCYTGLQIFSEANMEIKQNRDSPHTKIHWSEGVLFEVRFLQIQAEKFSVYCYLWCR
jgi:hypothetical protein